MVKSLHFVTNSENVPLVEKLDFLKNSARVFGRTALCLSGGATIGYYHIGVVKALFENNVLPKVITGSSAGSLIGECQRDSETW